ncbi:hypothetical protein CaCOL14_002419 [Colletotrichum acutatum]
MLASCLCGIRPSSWADPRYRHVTDIDGRYISCMTCRQHTFYHQDRYTQSIFVLQYHHPSPKSLTSVINRSSSSTTYLDFTDQALTSCHTNPKANLVCPCSYTWPLSPTSAILHAISTIGPGKRRLSLLRAYAATKSFPFVMPPMICNNKF